MKHPTRRTIAVAQLGLAAVAAVLTALSVMAWASRQGDQAQSAHLLSQYAALVAGPAETNKTDKTDKNAPHSSAESDKAKSRRDAAVKRIQKRHVFSVEKHESFSAQLAGVLGDKAYFNGQDDGLGVGQQINGATIKQIGPDWVEVEFDGKPRRLWVFGEGSNGPSSSSGPPSGPPPGRPHGMTIATPVRPDGPTSSRASHARLPAGFKLTPEMIKRFKQLPPDQQRKALETLPPDVRQQLEKAL